MIYYDRFEAAYVEEIDVNAPPERYFGYLKGEEGIYTERYRVYVNGDNNYFLDFSYSSLMRNHFPKEVAKERLLHFERNNIPKEATMLVAYIVPPSVYDKIVKEWDLKAEGGAEG